MSSNGNNTKNNWIFQEFLFLLDRNPAMNPTSFIARTCGELVEPRSASRNQDSVMV